MMISSKKYIVQQYENMRKSNMKLEIYLIQNLQKDNPKFLSNTKYSLKLN